MGINAVKGVEIGAGVKLVKSLNGSQNNDEMSSRGFISNNADRC